MVKFLKYDLSVSKLLIRSCIVQKQISLLTTEDNSSTVMFLLTAVLYFSMATSELANDWTSSKLAENTKRKKKRITPYIKRSVHSDGLTLHSGHIQSDKTASIMREPKRNAFMSQGDIQSQHKRCQRVLKYQEDTNLTP